MTGNINPKSEGLTQKLQEKQMDLDAGLLGKVFGSAQNAPSNIAGLVIIVLVFTGVCCFIWPPAGTSPLEVWKLLIPVITMILGYLFGRRDA